MANNLHMNGRQFEVEKAKLKDERQVLKELKTTYQQASKDIARKIRIQQGRINVLLKNIDNLSEAEKSILQAAAYQKQFQEQLKKQIDGFIDTLNTSQHESMDKYLQKCYETGFIGSMYDMHGQGVPIIAPINQNQVARATALTPKLSRKMYGTYAGDVKQAVRREISRGIATASTYAEIARNINAATHVGFNKMMRIARTEGHRIQCLSAFDAQHAAKDAGADVVKQWDAALDGRTRETHQQLDGQIRELDEPFEVDGMTAMYPSDFGDPAEDINCRCALTQRARWALDEDELQTLQDRAEFFGLDKAKNFEDFRKKYLGAADDIPLFKSLVKEGERVYTEKEIKVIAHETNAIANKHVGNDSKWSGKILVDDARGRIAKDWNCDILTTSKTSPFAILHEQLHAHSISYYDPATYLQFKYIEEGVVNLMTEEISRIEGIKIVSSKAYSPFVDSLKKLKTKLNISGSDYEFARKLIEMKVPDRIEWLENQIEDVIMTKTIAEMKEINELIDILRGKK